MLNFSMKMSDIKQTIILSNLLKQDEYLKTLAKFDRGLFATRIFNTLDLANYLLQLSGVVLNKQFINNQDLSASLYHKVKKIEYFENYTFKDVIGLLNSVNSLRYSIVNNEENEINTKLVVGTFQRKNEAVKSFYSLLNEYLNKNNLVDEVGIVRFALENTKSFENINFVRYDNELLMPLEIALLNKAAGKDVTPSKLGDNKILIIKSYTKAFGQVNEVERIIDYINTNKIPFDECLVAAADLKDYSKILSNYRDVLGIPLTIGGGTSILETNPGKMFAAITEWINGHYHTDYFNQIIYSTFFNLNKLKEELEIPEDFTDLNSDLEYPHLLDEETVFKIIGDLKLGFDSNVNSERYEAAKALVDKNPDDVEYKSKGKALVFVQKFIEVINKGKANFIEEYTLLDEDNLAVEQAALDKITTLLSYITNYDIPEEDIEKMILGITLGSEKPQPGYLHVTTIEKSISCLRNHLFVAGLSSNNFPGKSVEDPIVMDIDYAKFGISEFSNKKVIENKDSYFTLLGFANEMGSDIHISYAYYNSESLKEQNASSVIFETYKKEFGEDKTLEDLNNSFKNGGKFLTVSYFENKLLSSSEVGKNIKEHKRIETKTIDSKEHKDIVVDFACGRKGFSASAVTNFAKCPYSFFLQSVLGLEEPDETDIYEVIDAMSLGTIAHSLLENLDKSKTTKQEFVALAKQKIDEYLVFHPTDNIGGKNKEKQEFANMMSNAYDLEEGEKAALRESDLSYEYDDPKIQIHGLPDKVIKLSDGTYKVIDYKTGRSVHHSVDDIPSMIQCTMYSYLVERRFKSKVSSFEYRYIKANKSVNSDDKGYDMATHYQNLTNVLTELKTALDTGISQTNTKSCDSCFYSGVCRKKKQK